MDQQARGKAVKKFVLMHMGFEPPTDEIMAAWGAWFREIADRTVENIGFGAGREVAKDGVQELPMRADSVTGLSIITAESLDEAEAIAARCPFVKSIRVYEIRGG